MQQNSRANFPSISEEDLQERSTDEGSALVRLSDMPKHIQAGRNGRKRHTSTIYRYIFRGIGGVKLEAWRLPDGWYSSRDAWARFIDRLTVAGRGAPQPSRVQSAAPAKRQRSVEAEIEAVRTSIKRRAGKTEETPLGPGPAPLAEKPRWDAVRGNSGSGSTSASASGNRPRTSGWYSTPSRSRGGPPASRTPSRGVRTMIPASGLPTRCAD
jgi:hypothetical protein